MRYKLKNTNIYGYYLDMLMKEFKSLKKEFKNVMDMTPVDVVFGINSTSVVDLFNNQLANKFDKLDDTITFTELRDTCQMFITHDIDVLMKATMIPAVVKDGTIELCKLNIDVNGERLRMLLLDNLEQLDLVWEHIKLSLRHEFGHIMDYILNYNGQEESEFKKTRALYDEQFDEYRDRFFDEKGQIKDRNNDEKEMERFHWYYEKLDGERIANELAGVDIDEFCNQTAQLSLHHKDFEIDLEIITHSIKVLDK